MDGRRCFQTVLPMMILVLLLASCTPQPTPTPVPPTLTPAPTVDVAAVQTAAAATVVARVAAEATATVAAIPTPTATPVPTNTPRPTDTPLPTNTPLPAATATPTAKPKPTKTPTPAISLDLTGMRYEQWGKPQHGCASFDDRAVVRKFNLEMTLTNHTGEAIREWYPDFYGAGGSLLTTCFYVYSAEGFPSIPPGESRTVTFASFCDTNDYVKEMKLTVLEKEYRRCFGPGGAIIACP